MLSLNRDFDSLVMNGATPSEAASIIWHGSMTMGDRLSIQLQLIQLLIDSRVRQHDLFIDIDLLLADLQERKNTIDGDHKQSINYDDLLKKVKKSIEIAKICESYRTVDRSFAKLGDVILIPLLNGQYAYGHVSVLSKCFGKLTTIFGVFESVVDVPTALGSPMFGPIRFGIDYAIKSGTYPIVGESASNRKDFEAQFLGFNSTPNVADFHGDVYLETEFGEENLGFPIDVRYLDTETNIIWSIKHLEERIESGLNPFSIRMLQDP